MKKRDLTVFVYRNLSFDRVLWSIKDCRTGIVIGHSENVLLKNCKLLVSKAGQKRVRKTRTKNVHAGIKGVLLSCCSPFDGLIGHLEPDAEMNQAIHYNPYINNSFVNQDGESITEARFVYLSSKDGKSAVTGAL